MYAHRFSGFLKFTLCVKLFKSWTLNNYTKLDWTFVDFSNFTCDVGLQKINRLYTNYNLVSSKRFAFINRLRLSWLVFTFLLIFFVVTKRADSWWKIDVSNFYLRHVKNRYVLFIERLLDTSILLTFKRSASFF